MKNIPMNHNMMRSNKYKEMSFMKKQLVDQIEKIVKEKKEKLNVQTLNFEKEDISSLDGLVRIGYFLSRKNSRGISNFVEWGDVDGMVLIRVKERLNSNKFYGEKFVKGQNCRVRLKLDK